MTNIISGGGNKPAVNTRRPRSFYNLIDDFFTDDFPFKRSLAFDTFKVDIKEDDKDYVIEADIPGVDKENIKIDYDGDILTIAVEKEEKKDETKKNYVHRERSYSSMSRHIQLKNADLEGIKARLKDGVLVIEVPKKEKDNKGKRIEIE